MSVCTVIIKMGNGLLKVDYLMGMQWMGKRVEVCEPLVLCSLVDILNMHEWRKKVDSLGWNDDNDDVDVSGISAV